MNTAPSDTGSAVGPGAPPRTVTVKRGNIYLSREICEAYFPDMHSIALIVRDDKLLIMPLIQESAGGLLLKIRNARGDRVIQAQEFFRDQSYAEDFEEQSIAVQWSSDWAALILNKLRKTKSQVQT